MSEFNIKKALLVGVFTTGSTIDHTNQINELEGLVSTLGVQVIDKIIQYRKKIDVKYFIGKGKLKYIYESGIENKCKYVVINNEVSPSQIKNIQKYFKKDLIIMDRTGVILDIFNKHAKTNEAKKQIKLAQLEYFLPRLTRQWTHLERQMGGVGTRGGPGETQIEIDRRLIRNQIIKLKKDLSKISKSRLTQNKGRKSFFKVSLVGYTNAGKSSLMNSIALSENYVKDELFATLDTSTKKIKIDKNNSFLLSDTVGFIRNLPDNLVASFRSTLSEIIDSDLLLKVVDVSSDEYYTHISTINSVLNHLKISNKDFIIIFNKVDQITDKKIIQRLRAEYKNSIFVSAISKWNINIIIDEIKSKMVKENINMEISIPYNEGRLISKIYNTCNVISEIDETSHIKFRVNGSKENLDKIISKIKK
tara:strand:- start:331 stop:1590 length:1260 start_codon:yes stop_codon:yes gene_type:complete